MGCSKITWKIGDTFKLPIQLTIDGEPQSLAGWNVKCQLRHKGVLVSELVYVVIDSDQGLYSLEEPGSTQSWLPGLYTSDIEYTDPNGLVVSTETFIINFVPDETHV